MAIESGQKQVQVVAESSEVLAKLTSTMENFNVALSNFKGTSELQASNKQALDDIIDSSRNMVKDVNRLVELNTKLNSELDKQGQQATRIERKVETFMENIKRLEEKVAYKDREIEVLRREIKSQPQPISGSGCAIV
ncbi:unnamed protein product [Orchesella dallaii]|uniref:t-SNARE coiled-coil homology domain-containing protein n=1 Tax=Orchesella dallaii TaxID=48710 RepID=A0ABP1S5S7_9HEXA